MNQQYVKINLTPRPRTRDELAEIIGVSPSTLYRRIRAHKLRIKGKILLPPYQAKILEIFLIQVSFD